MRRTKFILLAFVAALVLMGAAYAAWTQTFIISSTVETGELFIKVDNTENTVMVDNGSGVYNVVNDPEAVGLDFSVEKDEVREGDNTTLSEISYSIDRMYPGTKIISKFNFTNLGTINAVASATSPTVTDNELWKQLVIRVNGNTITGDTANDKMVNLREAIKNAVDELKVNDTTKTVTIEQELPYSSTNATENQNLNWSVTLTFTQSQN